MRSLRHACLVVLLGAALAPAASSSSDLVSTTDVATDPAGDIVLSSMVGGGGAVDAFSSLDLTGLRIDEDTDGLWFRVTFKELQATPVPGTNAGYTRTYFELEGNRYMVELNRPLDSNANQAFAALMAYDAAQDRYLMQGPLETFTAVGERAISAYVPRDTLQDSAGSPPMKGHVLSNVYVESIAHVPATVTNINLGVAAVPPVATVSDRMPDGEGVLPYSVSYGLMQEGTVRLAANEPYRASNGEAATFIYHLTATNTGDREDLYSISTVKAPANWQVFFPSDELALEADETAEVPVLLVLPFAHQHGTVEEAVIAIESLTDPRNHAETSIGIRYLAIPQPAGHHHDLYLHTVGLGPAAGAVNPLLGGTDALVMMNTQETYEAADEAPARGFGRSTNDGGSKFGWTIHLEPGLEMGLDFATEKTGAILASVQADRPLSGAVLGGRLILLAPTDVEKPNRYSPYDDREMTVLATINGTAPIDLGAGEQALLEATIVPTPESDLIAYLPGREMVLELELTDTLALTLGTAPRLMSGSHLTLPLNEYSDPVDDAFDSFAGKVLQVFGEREQSANPGEGAVFSLALANPSDEPKSFHLSVEGPFSGLCTLSMPEHVTLGGHESIDLKLLVQVPSEARDAERLDVVLGASDQDEAAGRVLLRLAVVVDTEADHPDGARTFLVSSAKESPGLGLIGLLGLLALSISLRRRQ